MQFTRLGNSGLRVSRICLGCMTYGSKRWRDWILEEEESRPFIQRALEAGINFFDTADVYSIGVSEEILGRALKDFAKRHEVVIATKVHGTMSRAPNDSGLSRKHIFDAIDNSLRRLGTDYVDLYQIHRWDYDTPIEETLEALNDVVRAGKARYLGASSMGAWQMMKAIGLQRQDRLAGFVSMQNHYNLVYREEEREMLPLCLSEGIGVIPWSPLARGLLTGSWAQKTLRARTDEFGKTLYREERDRPVVDAAATVAKRHGVPPAQVALAWLLARPGVSAPIIGASKPGHLEDAVAALALKLSDDDLRALEEPYQPHGVLGHR
jgi:aryl-alcohol dehydrogenase-like predicted oxidoreductase